LVLHACDNSIEAQARREAENKPQCASWEESEHFYENNIIGIESNAKLASISYQFSQDLTKKKEDRELTQRDLVK